MQSSDTTITFSTTATATITLEFYQNNNAQRGYTVKKGNDVLYTLMAAKNNVEGYETAAPVAGVTFNYNDNIGTNYKYSKGTIKIIMTNCPAGTYSINPNGDYTVHFRAATINQQVVTTKTVKEIAATVSKGTDSITVNNVNLLDTNNNKIAITTGYTAKVFNSSNNEVSNYSSGLTAGERYTVKLSYGDYTKYETVVIPGLNEITTNKTFVFRTDTSNGNEVTASYEGNFGVVNNEILLDATTGKIAPRAEQYAQFTTGAKISFYVKAGALVTVTGHSSLTDFSLTGEANSQSVTATHFYTSDTLVTVTSNTSGGFIDSISVEYPAIVATTELSKDVTTDIDNKTYQLSNELDFSTTPFQLTSNLGAGTGGCPQFGQNTVISFYTNVGAEIVITGYDTNYGVFDIYVNGELLDIEIDSNAKYTFTLATAAKVELKCKNVGTENPDYSHSYLAGIKVSYSN